MTKIEICSYCRRDMWKCECENFHPNIIVDEEFIFELEPEYREEADSEEVDVILEDDEDKPTPKVIPFTLLSYPPLNAHITGIAALDVFQLTSLECKVILKHLERDYISYENEELHRILNEMYQFVDRSEE